MSELAEGSQVAKKSEVTGDPKRVVRRWLLELKLADKREAEWRKKAKEVINRYKLKDKKKGTYNILWANTETLRPAIYNSAPVPDVRRRFRDADPLGKAVSEVLERALAFLVEDTNIDYVCQAGCLDMLLPGRAVLWARYVPSISYQSIEGAEEPQEQLDWEQAELELVQWDDYRQGPGKAWTEIPWVARHHKMTREQLIEKFGEIGDKVTLDEADDGDVQKTDDKSVKSLFQTATVWEIWNKDDLEVLFVAPSYRDAPLRQEQDPLNLKGFFPCPEPLMAIDDPDGMIPVPHYTMYEEQALELDRISKRLAGLIESIKANGIYDSRLAELSQLSTAAENELIPAQNVTAALAALGGSGGLDKVIWMRPIEAYTKVFVELLTQRETLKQTIYEITGISDILRGSSVASETATAQSIKNQWGTLRIQRMRRELQRWIRDGIRLMAEIISQRFQVETLQQMTGLQFPTMEQKQQAQMLVQQAQAMQQPVPPDVEEMASAISWEEIVDVLRSDPSREFRIDIETDSTVAESVDRDMNGLKEVLTGLVQFWQGVGPAVQVGAIPIEAVKEISLSIARRAKLGMAVEDALDKMQQPQMQAGDPAAMAQAEAEKVKASEEIKAKAQVESAKIQAETQKQVEAIKAQASVEAEQFKAQKMVEAKQVESQNQAESVRQEIANLVNAHQNQLKQVVAQLSQQPGGEVTAQHLVESNAAMMQQIAQMMARMERAVTAPRQLVRDELGRPHMSVVNLQ